MQCHQLKFVEPARTPAKHAHHYYIFRNNIDKIAELFLNRIQIKYTLLKYRYGNGRKKKRGEKEGNLMFFQDHGPPKYIKLFKKKKNYSPAISIELS